MEMNYECGSDRFRLELPFWVIMLAAPQRSRFHSFKTLGHVRQGGLLFVDAKIEAAAPLHRVGIAGLDFSYTSLLSLGKSSDSISSNDDTGQRGHDDLAVVRIRLL